MPSKLRPEEEWARRVLSKALPGAHVTLHDDGSMPGMYDLRIKYPDGRTGAAEATAAAHAQAIELWRHITGERWVEPSLRGGWTVRMTPTARFKRLKQCLPKLLLQLESLGVTELDVWDWPEKPEVLLAGTLGMVSARQGPTEYPGSIYPLIALPHDQVGGWVSDVGDPLASWLTDWVPDPKRSDNVTKLGASGTDERHLVVIVAGLGNVPFHVTDILLRDDPPLPTIPPVLPDEITHVWVMSTWSSGHGIRWSRTGMWQRFDKLIDTWFDST